MRMAVHRTVAFFSAIAFSLLLPVCVLGVGTSFFRAETFADFSQATPENISVRSDGNATLSPPLTLRFESSDPYIWCVATDGRGNIFAGAGEEGKVYRIGSDGRSTVIFDSPEAEILCLAAGESGRIYAGTGPGGVIYEITDSGGKVLFDSEEEYVWCLAVEKNGDVIAGTGGEGKLYRVKKNGKAEVLFESGQPNITALTIHKGRIYSGSADRGIVYVTEGKKTKVLFDTELPEVRSILFDDSGDIIVGCSAGDTEGASAPRRPGGRSSSGDEETGSAPEQEPVGGSAIFTLSEEGLVRNLVPIHHPVLCMQLLPNGDAVVGTGEEGRILRVDRKGTVAVLNKVDAAQVVSMAANGDLVLSTGNLGKIYSLGKAFARTGHLTSTVYDAGPTSSWGVIAWDADTPGGTSMALKTRSGNTQKPDATWSEWSAAYSGRDPKVTSPEGRFIQWRATLSTKNTSVSPMLRNVSIAYVQKNVKPYLMVVTVGGGTERDQGHLNQSQGGGPQEFRGPLTVSWEVEDPNRDSLEFKVEFKESEQRNWLTMEDHLLLKSHTFDTQSLPDGKYRLKVTATDSLANPQGLALSDSRESDPFIIDNTPPEIFRMGSDVKAGRKYRVTFQVEDETTPVLNCEYSVDASPWRPVFPLDQIFDTREESFVLETPSLSVGQHVVVVRATDRTGNVSTRRLMIDAK
jgi:hypothetical protein